MAFKRFLIHITQNKLTMKKLLILAFVTIGGLGFTGCQKDETAVDLSTETAADLTSVEMRLQGMHCWQIR